MIGLQEMKAPLDDPLSTRRNLIPDDDEHVFPLRQSAATGALLWLAGGIAALALAAVGMGVALVVRVDQLALHFMTTLPTVIGLGALCSAWMTARTPRAVSVGPSGVRIISRGAAQIYPWDQIGWSTVQPGSLNMLRRHLKLYNVEGRVVAQVSDAIEDFDTLTELIAARITAKEDETADRIGRAKAKRTAVFWAVAAVALLALAGAIAWMTHRDLRAARLLQESAVPGEAEIEERFLAPNGVTPRLVYKITAPDGRSATRNAEVFRRLWDQLVGVKTVPVIYVPDEPWISRLAFGEPEDRELTKQPLIGYGLPALAAALSIYLLVAAVLMWRGWDIDFDSKTGHIAIKRFGAGR